MEKPESSVEEKKFSKNTKYSNYRKGKASNSREKKDHTMRESKWQYSKKPNNDGIPDHNDWKFYAASEEIAKSIASIPFNYLGGTKFPLSGEVVSANSSADGYTKVYTTGQNALPSVMNLNYSNSIGVTNSRTQGANMAAVQLYTYVRHVNSGAKNYEAADLMMYILAIRDILSEFSQDKKILGCAGLYNYYNHNLPDLVIQAHGIDPQDLRANLAQYRGRLNLLAKKINSFAIPKYFKVFDRSVFIASYLFTDSNSIRGQFYNFNKIGYYTWSPITSEQGTELVFALHNRANQKFGERLQVLENMLDALFLDEDALTMSGDMLKAFTEAELYTLPQTPEDYIVPVTMDEDVLAQIENSHAVGFLPANVPADNSLAKLNVTQQDQIIKFNPVVRGYLSVLALELNRYAFNSHKDNPDYKDVLEWTRLMTVGHHTHTYRTNAAGGSINEVVIDSTGLEIIYTYSICTITYSTVGGTQMAEIVDVPTVIGVGNSGLDLNSVMRMASVEEFDWHPMMYLYYTAAPSGSEQRAIVLASDLKNATTIDRETLNAINDAAVYGALYGAGLYNHKD